MPLSVAHINFSDGIGGATEIMHNLVQTHRSSGMNCTVFSARPVRAGSRLLGFGIKNKAHLLLKILQKASVIRNRILNDTDGVCTRLYYKQLTSPVPDIYHIHNIHGGWFSLGLLPRLAKKAPIVWTLHDEWAITGHCVATLGCERWLCGCGDCPHLDTMVSVWKDNASNNWLKRKQIYAQLSDAGTTMVPVSKWLAGRVSESAIWHGSTVAIPNGIDTNVFYPSSKEEARNALGLDLSSKIVLCGAVGGTNNPFKNAGLIFDILNYLQLKQKITIVLIGNANRIHQNNKMISYVTPGQITDRELMRKYYVASDLVFYPTKADSFGLIVAEAMACATPVMSSAIGGVCEIIEPDYNGCLFAADASAKDIALKMKLLLEDSNKLKDLGEKAHRTIKDKYSLDNMAQQYLNLYSSVIKKSQKKGRTD
jgi:glycosyltransferase involved in cell wall biosynthesis